MLGHRRDYIPYVGSHWKMGQGQYGLLVISERESNLGTKFLDRWAVQHSVDLENQVLDDSIIENRVVVVPRCTLFFCC